MSEEFEEGAFDENAGENAGENSDQGAGEGSAENADETQWDSDEDEVWHEDLEALMDEEDLPAVPELLHSFEHDGLFRHCIDCKMPLAEQVQPHTVQKVYRKGEVIMEFAICEGCHGRLMEGFSEKTKQNLNAYFEEHADPFADFNTCTVCARPRSTFDEFNVTGMCFKDRLIQSCCLCLDCMTGLQDLVSQQTRDARNDFIDRNFPGVPAGVDRPVLV